MIKSRSVRKTVPLILMTVSLLFLAACTPRGTPIEPAQSPPASSTPAASSTTVPSPTAMHTLQPSATYTSMPVSPTPAGPDIKGLPIISSENVSRLTQVASIELNEGDQVTWSPSGEAFAVSSPSGMKIYRLESFSDPISIRYESQPYFSADGTYLAVRLENGDVQVWDLDQGTLLGDYTGLLGEVVTMAFSPTNDLLAAVSINNQVVVWDLASGETSAVLEVPEFVIPITYTYDLLFSPDQSQLTLFREGEALLWDIDGDEEPRRLHWQPPPASPVHGPVEFSPDWGAIAWSDRGSIMIMDSASGELLNEFERQVGANYVFTQDWGSLVTIGYDDTFISVWDPIRGEALELLEHPETAFTFWLSPDERYLASLTFDGRATLWDLTTGEELAELSAVGSGGDWVVFSPQSNRLALLLSDGRISVWDILGTELKFTLDSQATRTFLFSPDGSLLVTMSPVGGLQVWNTASGDQMWTLDLAGTNVDITPSFAYGGRLLAFETNNSLQFWGIE